MIRQVTVHDASALCAIYNHYVRETLVTFEEAPLSPQVMEERIRTVGAAYPWFVHDDGACVSGYAYASLWKERSAYRFSAETTVYVKEGHEGEGIGTQLYARLLEAAQKAGIHALVAGVTLPNERSVALQEKFGFIQVAHFSEVGYKQGQWLDVGYWERVLKP